MQAAFSALSEGMSDRIKALRGCTFLIKYLIKYLNLQVDKRRDDIYNER